MKLKIKISNIKDVIKRTDSETPTLVPLWKHQEIAIAKMVGKCYGIFCLPSSTPPFLASLQFGLNP